MAKKYIYQEGNLCGYNWLLTTLISISSSINQSSEAYNDIKYGLEIKSSNSDNPKSLNVFVKEKVIDKPYLTGLTMGGIRETIKAIPIYTVGCRFPYD